MRTLLRIGLLIGLLFGVTGPAAACTSFVLEDEGDLYFVHSLNQGSMERIRGAAYLNPRGLWKNGFRFADLFDPDNDAPPELVWRSRYGSVTFSPLGYNLPDGGLNEAGLFIWEMGYDTEYPADETVPTLFQMQWMQYQLDSFATVSEVLAHLDRVQLDGWGWHYFVADTSGAAAIIDFPDGRPEVFTGTQLPLRVCGNAYYPSVMDWLDEHEGFGGDLPYRQEFSEIPRFITGARRLEAYAGQDPVAYSLETLQAMSVNVRWSVVFDVTRGVAHFTTNLDSDVRRFAFGPDDFQPGRPVRRLDIDTPGPGDVKDRFVAHAPQKETDYIGQILAQLYPDDTTGNEALAEQIIVRLATPPADPPIDLTGTWQGTLSLARDKELQSWPLTLVLQERDGRLTGEITGESLGSHRPIVNGRTAAGLVEFVTESGGGDRFDFRLHLSGRGLEGSVGTWDWENRKRAVVFLERSP